MQLSIALAIINLFLGIIMTIINIVRDDDAGWLGIRSIYLISAAAG